MEECNKSEEIFYGEKRTDLLKRHARPLVSIHTSEDGKYCSLRCAYVSKPLNYQCVLFGYVLNPEGLDGINLLRCTECILRSE